MIVLGIDPGSRVTGYSVIKTSTRKEELVDFGVVRQKKADHHLRLRKIYESVTLLIDEHKPDQCAVEMPVYGKNPQSMLKLGRAQAAAMLAALNRQIPVVEYTPKEVKKSVTGNGNASKQQVWYMVCSLLNVPELLQDMPMDASDAIAVGLCHIQRGESGNERAYSSWSAFVKQHADRAL